MNSHFRNDVELDLLAGAPAIAVRDVARIYGSFVALEKVSFAIAARRFVSLVGPSGCGKSTLLNMLAGLSSPNAGTIEIFGELLSGLNRRAACMFQRDALFPWKTVLDNVQLGLQLQGHTRAEAAERGQEWLHRIGLDGFGLHYPHQLSGGMRKRVAMAQCWIVRPDLVLMDEPFSALDVHTRLKMEGEILSLWSATETTVVFVTHDLDEAIALSDEVLLLSAAPRTRVVARYPIDLPRPRNLVDIKSDSCFQDLYRTLWQDLRTEVLKVEDRIPA
jgi:NitT/TauT family transport system ATP-binding protein